MPRLMVNATLAEIAAARRGPVRWDIAIHGALLDASIAGTTVVPLPRRSSLDTRRVLARLRSSRDGSSPDAFALRGPPVSDVGGRRPSSALRGARARAEAAARLVLQTDIVRVPSGVDAVFTHLRGARTARRSVSVVRSTNGVIPEAWTWSPSGADLHVRAQQCALERSLAARAEVVLCWTEYGADNLVAAGVDVKKIAVVPPLLDLSDPAPLDVEPTELVRAVFVGEDGFLKGLPEVLAAVASTPSVELHVVGPPPPTSAPERTRWHGRLSPGEVSALLVEADLLVVPARCESFGVTHLEAMRHGVAVIGSTIGTTREIVGDAGVLVPAGDADALRAAMAGLASDATARAALGAAGRRRYEERYAPAVVAVALSRVLAT